VIPRRIILVASYKLMEIDRALSSLREVGGFPRCMRDGGDKKFPARRFVDITSAITRPPLSCQQGTSDFLILVLRLSLAAAIFLPGPLFWIDDQDSHLVFSAAE